MVEAAPAPDVTAPTLMPVEPTLTSGEPARRPAETVPVETDTLGTTQ